MKTDFGFDEGTAAKLAVGLGDGVMPALSLFGPPMVDYHTKGNVQVRAQVPQVLPVVEVAAASMQHSLLVTTGQGMPMLHLDLRRDEASRGCPYGMAHCTLHTTRYTYWVARYT